MERLTPFPDEQRTITRQRSSWSRFIVFFAVVLFSNLMPMVTWLRGPNGQLARPGAVVDWGHVGTPGRQPPRDDPKV